MDNPEIMLANDPRHIDEVPFDPPWNTDQYQNLFYDATNMALTALHEKDLREEWAIGSWEMLPELYGSEEVRSLCWCIATEVNGIISTTLWPFFERSLHSKYPSIIDHMRPTVSIWGRMNKLKVPFLAHGFIGPKNIFKEDNKLFYGRDIQPPLAERGELAMSWVPNSAIPGWRENFGPDPAKAILDTTYEAMVEARYSEPVVPNTCKQ